MSSVYQYQTAGNAAPQVQQPLPDSPPPEVDHGGHNKAPVFQPFQPLGAYSSHVQSQPFYYPMNHSASSVGPNAASGMHHKHHLGGISQHHHQQNGISDSPDATLSAFLSSSFSKLQSLATSGSPSRLPFAHSKSHSDDLPKSLNNSTLQSGKSALPDAAAFRFAGLCALWYASSALSNNTGKSILARFRYPVTLTLIQFGFVAGYCVLFCALREKLSEMNSHRGLHARRASSIGGGGGGSISRRRSASMGFLDSLSAWGIKRPGKQALHGTLIMSFFQIAGHVFSSMATARIPVSTVHTIKALSPLFTVASYALLFRVRYSASTYISLIPLTLGVMLACSFDFRANGTGLTCALGSTVIFVSQNIFSKKLLPKENETPSHGITRSASQQAANDGKLDKVNLLLYSSGMAFLLMIPIWLYSDFSTLLAPKPIPPNPTAPSTLFGLFLLNGSVHFGQCLLAFSILARSTPVAYSIASLIKRIAVICLAIVWFGQSIRVVQALGMIMTFTGLYMYNQAKTKGDIAKGERKRGVMEKRSQLLLPTTANDARMLLDTSVDTTPNITPISTPLPFPTQNANNLPPLFTQSAPPPPPPHHQQHHETPIPAWSKMQISASTSESRNRNHSIVASSLLPGTSGTEQQPHLLAAR